MLFQQGPARGSGGASRDRTDDPLLAKQVLSHLSYGPGVYKSPHITARTLADESAKHRTHNPQLGRALCSSEGRKLVRTPVRQVVLCSKGGDPAAPSDTATLLRLHPSHRPHRGKRPPLAWLSYLLLVQQTPMV